MNRVKDHIRLSNQVMRCKNCKCLMIAKYLDDKLCEKCKKQYKFMIRKALMI